MRETTLSDLRHHPKLYLEAVEQGETVRILRHGKPIADLTPISSVKPAWKEIPEPLIIPGLTLSEEILRDRAEANR